MTSEGRPAAERPHALFVGLPFPPSRTGGVNRALATANGLAAAGFDVTVLTVDREFFRRNKGVDEQLETLIDPSITVVRVPLSLPRQEWNLRRWSRARVYSPTAWLERRTRRTAQVFPEANYSEWADDLVAAAFRVHRARNVDVTVATVNPNVDAYAAYRLHEKHAVPFVVDQRDAWTLNQFDGTRALAEDSDEARWERRIFEAAAEVWFVNDAMRAWHAATYPTVAPRMRVVMNGWDDGLVRPAPPRTGDAPLRFGYIGTLVPPVPLQELLDGWHSAVADPALDDAVVDIRGHLGFHPVPNAEMVEQLRAAAPDRVSYGGPVAKAAVADTYAGMDALLMIIQGGPYVTTAKVFEYVATGLPVVSVHAPDAGCVEVLRDYPQWFPAASMEPADVADALCRAARSIRGSGSAERDACVAHAERFRRDRQLAPALAAVRRIAGLAEVSP